MRRFLPALVGLAIGAGCGGLTPSASQSYVPGQGIVLLDWTIGGQPPSATACAGVDHLDLHVNIGSGGVIIEPIPCTLTRLRYDHLPDGPGTVDVNAYDATGCIVSAGSADIVIGDTVPAAPSPTVALPALRRCH
jgi:hypothetical protein